MGTKHEYKLMVLPLPGLNTRHAAPCMEIRPYDVCINDKRQRQTPRGLFECTELRVHYVCSCILVEDRRGSLRVKP